MSSPALRARRCPVTTLDHARRAPGRRV